MTSLLTSRLIPAVLLAFVISTHASSAKAQQSSLGQVDFPTSGSEKAQAHFLRGVAALHSFWYEEAREEFVEATRIEPDFMMGYWGEAMAYNYPLWGIGQDMTAARKALEKIRESKKLTNRERAYLDAVKVLYGDGDKHARDKAYSAVMEKVYRDYPEDLEAACFYALSLLGSVELNEHSFLRQMKAGAIVLDVFQKRPNHPGAAHYIIHAFDDPEHAILALPAARRYALIAPEAAHARHMPSHIFLQLGMWPEVVASNESSWATSDAWVRRKKLALNTRDYHSLQWLQYAYMQQGRYTKAEDLLAQVRNDMIEFAASKKPGPNPFAPSYVGMVAAFVVETERWDQAETLLAPLQTTSPPQSSGSDNAAQQGMNHCGPAPPVSRRVYRGETLPIFIRGLAAAAKGSTEAQQRIADFQAMIKALADSPDSINSLRVKGLEIRQLEISAVLSASKNKFDEAIEMLRKATALEESAPPPSGPPVLVKPSHELLGDILLRAGRPKEAAQQFAISLLRQPNRARSLLGAARAAAKMGDAQRAGVAYALFVRQWQQGDLQLPELIEAQNYLKVAHSGASTSAP
jgi:tetratricopeptide (TPR) repeat protein